MKRIFKYAVLASLAVAAVSCNKFLDTIPDNRTDIDDVSKISKLLVSSYPKATGVRMFEARADYVSDVGIVGTDDEVNRQSFFWRAKINSTDKDSPDYLWQRLYYAIAVSNHALAAAENINDPEVVPFLAEAKLTRAFNHFYLACSFAKFYDPLTDNSSPGIPYVYEPEDVIIKEYERGTVASTWEKVEQDLLAGIKDLGLDSKYAVPRFHFNIAAANAFAARYYLYKGEWDEVIKYATVVIPKPTTFTANGNVATSDPANIFAQSSFHPWQTTYKESSSSTGIQLEYTKASNPANLLITDCVSNWGRNVYSWRYNTKQPDTDGTVRGPNVTGGTWAFRSYYSSSTMAYRIPKIGEHFVYTTATTGITHIMMPQLRAEEPLLSRAEAYAQKGELDNAIADLNIYARWRIENYDENRHLITLDKIVDFYSVLVGSDTHYMKVYNAYNTASMSFEQQCVLQCVLDFRRNEFKWEGLRYWDMNRYKMPITHTTVDGVSNTLYPGDDRWVLQIPETAELSNVELNPMTNFLSDEW